MHFQFNLKDPQVHFSCGVSVTNDIISIFDNVRISFARTKWETDSDLSIVNIYIMENCVYCFQFQ